MKTKALAIAFALAVAGPAHALDLVSGWDFSQLDAANSFPFLNPPPTAINTLEANYSDFDPTSGMGAESADFGTLYFNGMFGSFAGSDALPDLGSSPVLFPNANIVDPDGQADMTAPPMGSAAAKTILLGEGAQTDASDKRLAVAGDPSGGGLLDLVFSADLSTLAGTGSDWQLSFAGQTDSGSSNVDVAFSTDGSSYDPLQTVQLTTAADQFIIDVVGLPAVQGFFRLSFDGDAEIAPAVDNVVVKANVSVPEPASVLMLVAGLAGLGVTGRRRA